MTYYRKALYDEMTSFYIITSLDDADDLNRIRSFMGALVRKARSALTEEMNTKQKVEKLLKLMYQDWGFHCNPDNYFELENLYLNKVLENHYGMPVSLGAIILYLAESLDLPIYPINFPTQLILRVDIEDDIFFIDPWNGKKITLEKLQKLYEGALGFGAKLNEEDLKIADSRLIISRFCQLAKNALLREEKNYQALKYIESLLRQNPDDPYERRDRGISLVQLGCFKAALEDFNFFIEKCPEDPAALLLAAQLDDLKKEVTSVQ
ncbi:regulator of sirC expression with transglutaminase-like and TPR domain [Bisgaardia hudsonensis]|uniref:Regulator of sirC expression with transglutaminase-like and TPR domain n=1 Tax=Bisgaardia hudsonensis TaxID=109472 RepID=A0A4R2N0Y5_9PAST|nr:SirB1 family protein [Bisgaardia hudsonensis]QLB13245.1 hypothetical protein A6A11_06270 [Bisgaardia hudsonensis]TCP13174.1 regulator of sirC expression with transglutaminase-like and TPR domain [Bisgaardia hudsonensis]